MNEKPKIEGWRKMGIGMGAITALSLNPEVDFKIAIIIGAIAVIGMSWYGIIDYEKKPPKPD